MEPETTQALESPPGNDDNRTWAEAAERRAKAAEERAAQLAEQRVADAEERAKAAEQRVADAEERARNEAAEQRTQEQADTEAAAANRAEMVGVALGAGLSQEAAEKEVDEAMDRGESRTAYTQRKLVEVARTVNVQPERFGDIQRDGFQGLDLGRYVEAIHGRERRDAGHEIEFARLAREHYDGFVGAPVPFAAVMPMAAQRVLYTDVSGAIDLMVDMQNAIPFFAEMEPWLAWTTMVSMGYGSGAFQLPIDGGTDPSASTPVEGAEITESDPDISGTPMNALTVASYHTIGSGAFATGGPALSMFMRDIFQTFVQETFGAQILVGSGTSGQIAGIWGKLSSRNHDYGAAVTNLTYEDITSVYTLVKSAAAYGMYEGWVLAPSLEGALLAKQPFTNSGRAIATRDVGAGMGVGDIMGAGRYASTRSMAVASVNDPGIYGLWSRCVIPMWGTAFELIEQEQAKNNFREYSIRLYANMQLANVGAFARIKRT